MKCPKCRQEQPDGLSLCSGCALEFASWDAKAGRPAAAKPGAAVSGMGALVHGAVVTLVLGAMIGVVHAIRHPAAIIDELEEETEPEKPKVPVQTGPAPVARDAWRFEGVVYDLYRAKPVAGARVQFSKSTFWNDPFESVTDGQGRYLVDAKVRKEIGYYALVSHPDYRPSFYIDVTRRDLPNETWESRVNAGRQTMSFGPNYSGKAGRSVAFHFAIVPDNLTPEERKKVDAVPQ